MGARRFRGLLFLAGTVGIIASCDGSSGTRATNPVPRAHSGHGALPAIAGTPAWTQLQKLIPSPGAAGDYFGTSVAASGGTVVVGGPQTTVVSNTAQGAAWVFVETGNVFSQQSELLATGGAADDEFGTSVAVSGNTAVVGAPQATVGSNPKQGAAYVFVQSGDTWTQQAKLVATAGAADDAFGSSVAIAGGLVVVGAPQATVGTQTQAGAAYVFAQSGTTWAQQAKLTEPTPSGGDTFGASVAVSGTTVIVGAPNTQVGSNFAEGVAYAFVQSGTSWPEQAQLVVSAASANYNVGASVSVSGSLALLGAPFTSVSGDASEGVAHVFTQSGTTWTGSARLVASNGASGDFIGQSVSLSGGTAVAGAQADVGSNTQQGAAYVFVQSGTTWSQNTELVASDGNTGDFFGISVAVSGGTIVSGAYLATVGSNTTQGAAYVYALVTGSPCTAGSDCATAYCGAGSCASCTTDSDCGAGAFCASSGSCVPQQANGTACNVAPGGDCASPPCDQCTSGNCVGDYCCATTCDPCSTCPGGTTCAPIAASAPGSPSCSPYVCDGTAMTCPTACTDDSGCASGFYCSASGACVAQLGQGTACNQAAGADCLDAGCRDCATGYCVDGYCCDTACNTLCQACAASLKESGSGNGTCGDALAQTNPHDDPCATSSPTTCGPDGECSGTGGCSLYYPAGTSCGASSCDTTTNSAVGQLCDGSGTCGSSASGVACGEYLCANGACPSTCTEDAECIATAFCDGSTCVERGSLGASCTSADECGSGLCVDGVCCNSACTGQCEACDGAGTAKGSCSPVVGTPHGTRAPCPSADGGDVCQTATCNGQNTTSCAGFVGSSTVCRSAACQGTTTSVPGASCDGKGSCPAGTPIDCGAFACDPTTGQCNSSCATNAECAAGSTCQGGTCVAGATCTTDSSGVIPPGGTSADATPCSPFTCQDGQCMTACATVSDCQAPYVCNAAGACVEPASGSGGESGSGCAIGRRPDGVPSSALVIAVLGAAIARRRRRRMATAVPTAADSSV